MEAGASRPDSNPAALAVEFPAAGTLRIACCSPGSGAMGSRMRRRGCFASWRLDDARLRRLEDHDDDGHGCGYLSLRRQWNYTRRIEHDSGHRVLYAGRELDEQHDAKSDSRGQSRRFSHRLQGTRPWRTHGKLYAPPRSSGFRNLTRSGRFVQLLEDHLPGLEQ